MVNPPLWVWGIIVGIIITGKLIYRWQATKQFAKGDKTVDKIKDSSKGFDDNMKNNNFRNATDHKYSLKHYYKDYFAVKKKRK